MRGSSIVKPVRFNDPRIVGDATASVRIFSERFADEMVIIDLDANKSGTQELERYRKLSRLCIMPLTLGGGVKTVRDADDLISSGADKVTVNSAFYDNPTLLDVVAQKYGSQAVVFSLDCKLTRGRQMAVSQQGSRVESLQAIEAAQKAVDYGAGEILLNCIEQDGTMSGYNLDLIKAVSDVVDVPIIAAGGCGQPQDCVLAVQAGASAVAAGSIFFWIGDTIRSIKQHMGTKGIEVRLE